MGVVAPDGAVVVQARVVDVHDAGPGDDVGAAADGYGLVVLGGAGDMDHGGEEAEGFHLWRYLALVYATRGGEEVGRHTITARQRFSFGKWVA